MFKCNIANLEEDRIIKMQDMKPLDIGIIFSGEYANQYVMRTASSYNFEVMNLSYPEKDECWTGDRGFSLKVNLLPKGTKFVLEITD